MWYLQFVRTCLSLFLVYKVHPVSDSQLALKKVQGGSKFFGAAQCDLTRERDAPRPPQFYHVRINCGHPRLSRRVTNAIASEQTYHHDKHSYPSHNQSPYAKLSIYEFADLHRVIHPTTFAPQCQRCTSSKDAPSQFRQLQSMSTLKNSHPTFFPAGFTMMVRSSPPIDSGSHRRTRRVRTMALLAAIYHCVSGYNVLTFCSCR